MNNKKSIMAFSALQILFFHLWINVFPGNEIENFLRQTAYIGVDIFFFLSGYSLSKRRVENYRGFVFSRIRSVYLKFILFALIAWIIKGWSLSHFLKVFTGVNLMQKGGGAFLWFLPFIMLIYLIYPFFEKAYEKNAYFITTVVSLVWIIVPIFVEKLTSYRAMFIFWNRIPIFLIGFYLAKSELFSDICNDKKKCFFTGLVLTVIGEVLIYFFGYKVKLMTPFTDFFYIVGIISVLGLVLLLSLIPENKVISLIGKSTLEMYGVQMVFGYTIVNKIAATGLSPLVVNTCGFTIIIVLSIVLSLVKEQIGSKYK